MIASWRPAAQRALAGRAGWVWAVLALTMLRLLSDLGMGAAAATDAYLLTLAALGCVWCARRLVAAVSTEPPQDPRPVRPLPERPSRLVSLEESVDWAARSAHVRDTRLRPELRYAVADRLGRAGYYLGSHPAAATLLGPTTAALVESVEVAQAGTGMRGLDQSQLEALATELAGLDERIEQYHEGPYETGDGQ